MTPSNVIHVDFKLRKRIKPRAVNNENFIFTQEKRGTE